MTKGSEAMNFELFCWYIIIINILSFVIYVLDYRIYMHGGSGVKPAVLCNIIVIVGGSPGATLATIILSSIEFIPNKRTVH